MYIQWAIHILTQIQEIESWSTCHFYKKSPLKQGWRCLKEQLMGRRSCSFPCNKMSRVFRVSDVTGPQNSVWAKCGTEKERSIPAPGCGLLTEPWGKLWWNSSQTSRVWKHWVVSAGEDEFWETAAPGRFPQSRASHVSDTSLSPLVLVSYPFIDKWGEEGIRLPVGFSKPHTCTPLKSDKCQNLTVGEACVGTHHYLCLRTTVLHKHFPSTGAGPHP